MKQTKSAFVVKLQVEITSFLKMLSTMISYNCVSRKFHYIRSKTIKIQFSFDYHAYVYFTVTSFFDLAFLL